VTPLLLGVDGGNTMTIAVVLTGEGAVLGTGRAGCGDIHNARGPEAAVAEITAAVSAALAEAGIEASDLAAAAFGLAGADWPEDFVYLRRELRGRLGLTEAPEIVNDAVGGLRSGTDDMVGVSVVIGTYSALAGRNAAGELFHFGFWPDSTGAHGLGSQAIAAIWRHMLGLGPETTLLGRALERWGCGSAEELLHALTTVGGPDESEAGRFADAVLDEAEGGDEVAVEIVETVAGRMGDYARVCAVRTGQDGERFPLVLCGSVLRHPSPLLRAVLVSRVADGVPVYPDVEPVAGAGVLAADRVGARPDLAQLGAPLSRR
jgi:N-acetylglucosamine kinase-like BadF-type ATPase